MIKITYLVLIVIFLSSINTYADVRNEISFGGSMSVESEAKTDEDIHGLTTGLSYTYFFKPIKESGRTIELRQFHQHPSKISVSTGIQHYEEDESGNDYINDSEVYDLNAEIFIPSHTGFLIGLSKADSRTEYYTFNWEAEKLTKTVGVKQYIADMIELSLKYDQYEEKTSYKGGPDIDMEGDLLTFKAHLTLSDIAGFQLEKGKGDYKFECPNCSKNDEEVTNLELQLYGGMIFVFRLGRKELTIEDYEETTTYIKPKFWFGERFSMELNLFKREFDNSYGYNGDELGLALNYQIRF